MYSIQSHWTTLQRLWAQHCRVSQVLQDTAVESSQVLQNNQCELTGQTEFKRSFLLLCMKLIYYQIILESHATPSPENGNCSRRSVKDVIPESRLAQYYGNFYYDEVRLIHLKFSTHIIWTGELLLELGYFTNLGLGFALTYVFIFRENCYKIANEKISGRGYNGQGCENSDLTECWMLPEVTKIISFSIYCDFFPSQQH